MRDIQLKFTKISNRGCAPDTPVLDPPLCKMIYSRNFSKYTIYHPKNLHWSLGKFELLKISSILKKSRWYEHMHIINVLTTFGSMKKRINWIGQIIQFNSILYSLKTPDHWYMRYNIIIYKLHWFTGEGHKIQQMQKEEK